MARQQSMNGTLRTTAGTLVARQHQERTTREPSALFGIEQSQSNKDSRYYGYRNQ